MIVNWCAHSTFHIPHPQDSKGYNQQLPFVKHTDCWGKEDYVSVAGVAIVCVCVCVCVCVMLLEAQC